MDLLVVGAGLFGLTIAERAASAGCDVVVIDKRNHIAGNAFSSIDADTGIEIHHYGTHIFHTSTPNVWEYVNRFASFVPFIHTVHTVHRGKVYPMPITLQTLSMLYDRLMSPDEARAMIRSDAALDSDDGPSFESHAIERVGRRAYEALLRGYTSKQWQTDPKLLPASIAGRLPVRFTFQQDYFEDRWQGLPRDGYTAMAEHMAAHPRIDLRLATDFFDDGHAASQKSVSGRVPVVYTGPIDRYFEYAHGRLSWRTLDLATETLDTDDFQGTSVMNYADEDIAWTRIHEFQHLRQDRARAHAEGKTIIMREYSRAALDDDEPYYPVGTLTDRERLSAYRTMADAQSDTWFGGRLGTYQYLDMHMAIGSALSLWRNKLEPRFTGSSR